MTKKILVTAGSTSMPIDQVRCISNIFRGRTGHDIAKCLDSRGHDVTLITSSTNGNDLRDIAAEDYSLDFGGEIIGYKTYEELHAKMRDEIMLENYDAIIHSAAVSDYKVEGTYICSFEHESEAFQMQKLDSSGKVRSNHPELWLKMIPTEKIIDKIRTDWGFAGILVKFKLQVGISDEELLEIARASAAASHADLIVANCLEWMRERAFIVDTDGNHEEVSRFDLAYKLARRLES